VNDAMMGLLRDGLTVLFGALAGGVTNRIAIIMLFHPYEPPSVFGRPIRWLQGAVPKNRERMAKTIGRTIGTHLLAPADVAAELRDERLREAFDAQLHELVRGLLEDEKPAVADLVSDGALDDIRALAVSVLDGVRARLVDSLGEESFAEEAGHTLGRLATALDDEALADTLPADRLQDLRQQAEDWLDRLAASDEFEDTIREHLDRVAGRLLEPGRSFEELLPPVVVEAVESAIADYLPIAMERLGRTLEDPDARARVERAIHDLLDRFMRDLRFHQRVVAKLIITEDTVDKVIDTLEAEGADRLGDLLREREVQAAMARGVNEAIVEFLRRPVVDVLGEPGEPRVESALDSLAVWVSGAARDTGVRAFLLDRAEAGLLRLGERSWGEVVRLIPAERLGGWLATGLASDTGLELYGETRDRIVDRLLHQPIGALGGSGSDDAARRVSEALSEPVWDWISSKVPEVAARVRVAERVEDKIVEFPLDEVERLIREVSGRELNLIVRLGYLLGAFIGVALVLVRHVIG
jgi:uncharacterized membrane-anchored protein YjiN (DUF445 family)